MNNKTFDTIVFDLDSTLVTFEGLDWLAKLKNKERKLSKLTKLSMDGKLKLKDVFEKKMNAIRPTYNDFEKLGDAYCKSLVEDIVEVISCFLFMKKEVYILTGNFDPAVTILAKHIGIAEQNVFTNKIYFDKKGEYVKFDSEGPLSINGGKSIILKEINHGRRVVFVGDGITDIEAKGSVDLFVGFGGIARREYVEKNSDAYIRSKSMSPLLPIALNTEEKKSLKNTKYMNLLKKGDKLLKST